MLAELGALFDDFGTERAFPGKESLVDMAYGICHLVLDKLVANIYRPKRFDSFDFADVSNHLGRLEPDARGLCGIKQKSHNGLAVLGHITIGQDGKTFFGIFLEDFLLEQDLIVDDLARSTDRTENRHHLELFGSGVIHASVTRMVIIVFLQIVPSGCVQRTFIVETDIQIGYTPSEAVTEREWRNFPEGHLLMAVRADRFFPGHDPLQHLLFGFDRHDIFLSRKTGNCAIAGNR